MLVQACCMPWAKRLVARGARGPLCRAEKRSLPCCPTARLTACIKACALAERSCCFSCYCNWFACRLPGLLSVERREWWITMLVPLLTWCQNVLLVLDGSASFNWAAQDSTLLVRATWCFFITWTSKLAVTFMVSGVTPVSFFDSARGCCLSSKGTKSLP